MNDKELSLERDTLEKIIYKWRYKEAYINFRNKLPKEDV